MRVDGEIRVSLIGLLFTADGYWHSHHHHHRAHHQYHFARILVQIKETKDNLG